MRVNWLVTFATIAAKERQKMAVIAVIGIPGRGRGSTGFEFPD
jgi:hypothetical protein